MFGFRAWSERDLDDIDTDDLDELIDAAQRHEADQRKQAAEARRGR